MRDVAAAEIMPRFRNLSPHDIRYKDGAADVVTVADIAAERRLSEELTNLLAGSTVVGEEAAAADPGVLASLGGSAPVWVIDPVDGTQNYVDGKAYFAVVVGLCYGGEPVAGWILDPIRGGIVYGGVGAGAWRDDGARQQALSIGQGRPLEALTGSVDRRNRKRIEAERAMAKAGLPQTKHREGSVGQEYFELACGELDFAQYRRLKPWDHAAGILIHRLAGGVSRLRGTQRPYRAEPAIVEATVLLAPDPQSWAALDALLSN
jgi:fructose-1,6-bisphosphatase/inositol monophosphatase family enzyme